jgi:hypothetical protein
MFRVAPRSGRTSAMGYSRVLFVEPTVTTNVFHNNILNDVLNIDLRYFVRDFLTGALEWLNQAEPSANYQRNVGVPVIA